MAEQVVAKGLEGIIAAESRICKIDGVEGKLYYCGYAIEELTERCTFEEVTYLLLHGHLPDAAQLEDFSGKMRKSRDLAGPVIEMIRQFPEKAHPMELLQSAISYLSSSIRHKIQHSDTCDCRSTLHQVVQVASVLATFWRFRNGLGYVPARMDLSHGANFLYMLRGEEPDPLEGEIMEKCLILHAEHGFNASTFTARMVASTKSTCYCSISSAIGSLYGSLHGGANERVMEMVDAVGAKENARSWTEKALAEKRKIMGMGHRVYKVKDPRATIIEGLLNDLTALKKESRNLDILKEIEGVVVEKMETDGKQIYPNVDFFSGAVYRLLDIDPILFTPIFAMSRVSGWLAHIMEQRIDNRLFRPKALYVGPEPLEFIPLDQR